jgi:hypothetical protein
VSSQEVAASTRLSRSKTAGAYVIRLRGELHDGDEARSVILDTNPCIVHVAEQHADSSLADVPCGMHAADLHELLSLPGLPPRISSLSTKTGAYEQGLMPEAAGITRS